MDPMTKFMLIAGALAFMGMFVPNPRYRNQRQRSEYLLNEAERRKRLGGNAR